MENIRTQASGNLRGGDEKTRVCGSQPCLLPSLEWRAAVWVRKTGSPQRKLENRWHECLDALPPLVPLPRPPPGSPANRHAPSPLAVPLQVPASGAFCLQSRDQPAISDHPFQPLWDTHARVPWDRHSRKERWPQS